MFESLRKFVDILFKSLGIAMIVATCVFIVILFKSCSSGIEAIDSSKVQISQSLKVK